MTKLRIRALVLAAGEGTRLRPLTSFLPKPLLPVAGRPLIEHTLDRLVKVGCEAVAINLHHRGDAIRGHLGDDHQGMPITWSEERDERLGTLGALHPLRDFLRPADVILLVNGDSLCAWPFARLLRRHRDGGAAATLLLATRPDPEDFGGGVALDRQGRVVAFSKGETARGEVARRAVFAGAHALSPTLLARVGEGPADVVRQLYRPLLADGATIAGILTRRRWHDLGTPRRYLDGCLDWARGAAPMRWFRRSWASPEAKLAERVKLTASAVEAGAAVGRGARLNRSLVLPGGRVGEGAELEETIVGLGAALPARSRIARQVVVVAKKGVAAGEGDSRLEGHFYSHLDRVRRKENPGL